MKIYLVGGAVRDELLKLPVKERDYVVVGATPAEMLKNKFKQVGKDFPVFLHPKTNEEYALARQERKSGHGYHGFDFIADPSVTLEEDLLRRDLTINAIAKDENSNKLIDPYNGLKDLNNKILRHVSPAFSEDPLRVLRVARFAARFYSLGFKVADETLDLMQKISKSGELEHLTPERVYIEIKKALATNHPHIFFEVLRKTNSLKILLPEIDNLFGVPAKKEYHPEIDTGIHTLMVLEQATKLSDNLEIRFAALVHDLGKAKTPKENLPSHYGHEKLSGPLVKNLCNRFKIDNSTRELALLVAEHHGKMHRIHEMNPETILKFLHQLDAFRREERFNNFLIACEADSKGRKGFENIDYAQAKYLKDIFLAVKDIDLNKIIQKNPENSNLKGKEIADLIFNERTNIINNFMKN